MIGQLGGLSDFIYSCYCTSFMLSFAASSLAGIWCEHHVISVEDANTTLCQLVVRCNRRQSLSQCSTDQTLSARNQGVGENYGNFQVSQWPLFFVTGRQSHKNKVSIIIVPVIYPDIVFTKTLSFGRFLVRPRSGVKYWQNCMTGLHCSVSLKTPFNRRNGMSLGGLAAAALPQKVDGACSVAAKKCQKENEFRIFLYCT